jgi:hypothetical protein
MNFPADCIERVAGDVPARRTAMKNASKSITRTLLFPIGLGFVLPVMVTSCQGCKKDEPPPPLPSATAPATTTAPELVMAPEDAGFDAADAADAKKPLGKGGKPGGLSKCCQAIKQNAANAPMPTKAYLENLAASCFAVAKGGGMSFPAGAGYSSACK